MRKFKKVLILIFYILIKIFVYLALCLGFLNLIFEIIEEIFKKTYFKNRINSLKNNPLIIEKIEKNLPYGTLDLVFDLYYFLRNFLFYKKGSITRTIIFITIFALFWFIPVIYGILFLFWLWKDIWVIILSIIKGGTRVLEEENLEISPFYDWVSITKKLIKLPKYWARVIIYLTLKRSSTVSIKNFDYYVFSLIAQKPNWYIKLIFSWTKVIYENILGDEIFRRKSYKVWFKIIERKVKNEICRNMLKSYASLFGIFNNHRIEINNRKIILNPKYLEEFLNNYTGKKFSIYRMWVIKFNGQYHQVFIKKLNNTEWKGYVMTTSSIVNIDQQQIITQRLMNENIKQKYIYSAFILEELEAEEGNLKTFYRNFKLENYENYCGLILRLNIIEKLQTEISFILQCKKDVVLTLEKRTIQEQLGMLPHGDQKVKNVIDQQIASYDRVLENNDSILDELYCLNNTNFFRKLKHSKPDLINALEEELKNNFKEVRDRDDPHWF